jgi:outer membrane murein-binding lipoprotein Lpp
MEATLKLVERNQIDGLSKANENFNAKIAALESEIEELTNQ